MSSTDNPFFIALYSTDEVYVRQNQTECLSEELDMIKDSIPTDYARSNHTHTGYAASDHTHSGYAAENHEHSGYAAENHSHTEYAASNHDHDSAYAPAVAAITSHMGNQSYKITSATDYVTIPLTTSVIVGSGFSVVNNAIKVGAGISKIRISAQVCVGTGTPAAKYLAVRANVSTSPTQLARAQMRSHEYTTPETINISPIVLNISEGDLITLDYFGAEGDVIYGGVTLSYVTIEKLA